MPPQDDRKMADWGQHRTGKKAHDVCRGVSCSAYALRPFRAVSMPGDGEGQVSPPSVVEKKEFFWRVAMEKRKKNRNGANFFLAFPGIMIR
jgi:hypothetical protein